MFQVLTIEREFGSGAAGIARELANRMGWKLWDESLTEEIAKEAQVDRSAVARCEERMDSTFHRLAKTFWRGSYESSMPMAAGAPFDADCFVAIGQEVMARIASGGNCVIVGRGAPYFLRESCDAFHVFLYAPRAEKIRRLRLIGHSDSEAEELVDTVDRDRIEFVKHYFGADWPTRSLYHLMINTAVGDGCVISTILDSMQRLEKKPVTV